MKHLLLVVVVIHITGVNQIIALAATVIPFVTMMVIAYNVILLADVHISVLQIVLAILLAIVTIIWNAIHQYVQHLYALFVTNTTNQLKVMKQRFV